MSYLLPHLRSGWAVDQVRFSFFFLKFFLLFLFFCKGNRSREG